jgi:hypothetical protein
MACFSRSVASRAALALLSTALTFLVALVASVALALGHCACTPKFGLSWAQVWGAKRYSRSCWLSGRGRRGSNGLRIAFGVATSEGGGNTTVGVGDWEESSKTFPGGLSGGSLARSVTMECDRSLYFFAGDDGQDD